MDTPKTFLCTVMHPRLFPGPITDPGNPLRVEMLVEVGAEGLIIRAPAPSAKGKVMGTEPLAGSAGSPSSIWPAAHNGSKSCAAA